MKKIIIIICFTLTCSCINQDTKTSYSDKKDWAVSLKLEGVPNFNKVSEDLYRSAQPTSEGMINLKAMGIKTIVNLRSFNSDRDEIGETGLGYEHIYMKAW